MAGSEDRQNAALDAVTDALRADARSFAVQVRALAELAELAGVEEQAAGVPQFPMMELAGTARLGAVTASRRLAEAERIVSTLPDTLRLLGCGELLMHQARVVIAETASCDPEVARRAEAEVLPEATGWCPADLRKKLRRAVLRVESELDEERAAEQRRAEQRLADARAQRRTWVSSEPDGMGVASALMSAEQLRRWQLDLDQLERAERVADRQAGVERTSDQRRADLCAALPGMVLEARRALAAARRSREPAAAAAGTASPEPAPPPSDGLSQYAPAEPAADGPGRWWVDLPEQLQPGASAAPPARVVVNVLVPVSTVLDLSREPGSIEGVGPVSAEHVRLLRPVGFRRILIEHDTGRPVQVDERITPVDPDPVAARRQVLDMLRPAVAKEVAEPQHDPSVRLARLVDVRDAHCAGPGCSHANSDHDHLEPWPAGPTAAWNLGLLSERCHQAKHHGWTLTRHPDGSTTWTSPLGRSYDRPPPHPKPPTVDPDAELPPLRPPPTADPPWWADTTWTPPPDEPCAAQHADEDELPPF